MKKDPNIIYLERLHRDPKWQKVYQEESQLLDIAIKIAEAREKKAMSQKKLAKLSQTNQTVISRIETGKENMSLKKLFRVAAALGMRVKIDLM